MKRAPPNLVAISRLNRPRPLEPQRRFVRGPGQPPHLKCRADGEYMARECGGRCSFSMFPRNRTRVTAPQQRRNMADVGGQKCLHGNTPPRALGLRGSQLSPSIDVQYRGHKHREMFE